MAEGVRSAVRLSLALTPSAPEPLTIFPRAWILPGSMLRLLVALLPTFLSAMRSRRHLLGRADGDDPVDVHGTNPHQLSKPWQNGDAERFVGTVRRELLDHVIVLKERHLQQLIESFVTYYNIDRTHLAVGKNSPSGRLAEQKPGLASNLVSLPRVGGLHHRYAWRQAA
jgi:hypothetical protein